MRTSGVEQNLCSAATHFKERGQADSSLLGGQAEFWLLL